MIATAVGAVDGEGRSYRCGTLPRFHCWSCKCLLLQRGPLAAAANLRVQRLWIVFLCTLRPLFAATTAVFCDAERGTRGFAITGRFFVVVVAVVVTSAISSLQKYVVASLFMPLQTQSCRCKGHVCSRKSVPAALQT